MLNLSIPAERLSSPADVLSSVESIVSSPFTRADESDVESSIVFPTVCEAFTYFSIASIFALSASDAVALSVSNSASIVFTVSSLTAMFLAPSFIALTPDFTEDTPPFTPVTAFFNVVSESPEMLSLALLTPALSPLSPVTPVCNAETPALIFLTPALSPSSPVTPFWSETTPL